MLIRFSATAAGKSYKEQKEMERRARAGDSVGWNASFVRSDTVVDALADRLGVGKSDILDREEVSNGSKAGRSITRGMFSSYRLP